MFSLFLSKVNFISWWGFLSSSLLGSKGIFLLKKVLYPWIELRLSLWLREMADFPCSWLVCLPFVFPPWGFYCQGKRTKSGFLPTRTRKSRKVDVGSEELRR